MYIVLIGNSDVSKNNGTTLWNFVPNSGLRKFCNCTLTVRCVVNLGGQLVATVISHQFITLSIHVLYTVMGVMQHVAWVCLRQLILVLFFSYSTLVLILRRECLE